MAKPLIGIGPRIVDLPGKPTIFGSYETFVRAIETFGGVAVILSPDAANLPGYADRLDGLLLTGGGDMHPKYFGEKLPRVKLSLSPDARTRFELRAVQAFLKADKPVLGICLGCQTLNVALRGKLIQDIPTEIGTLRNHREGRHPITIAPDTLLRRILGKAVISVNSRHHQSVSRTGRTLVVAAFSPDGVIEAIESTEYRFAVGVQWHPELLLQEPETARLLKAFLKAAGSSSRASRRARGRTG